MIESLIKFARDRKASDIHLTYGLPATMRVNGELKYMTDISLHDDEIYKLLSEMIDEDQFAYLADGHDLDFAYQSDTKERQRVNVYRQKGHYAVAIRLLNSSIPTIDQLELPTILKDIALAKRGLILVTGPTGSGKSTTLAAMIDRINSTKKVHVLTLEDPIEYEHNHKYSMINQREVGHKKDASNYASALKSALREDPDVILVGEMRDYETIALALTAAETGHLVFSTLHTSSAAQTIDRIIDVFPPNQQSQIRSQLSTSLKCIVAQQLIPREDISGRCAVTEILINNDAIGNMIRDHKTFQIDSVIQTRGSEGMETFDMSLARLVIEGKISENRARKYAHNPQIMSKFVNYL